MVATALKGTLGVRHVPVNTGVCLVRSEGESWNCDAGSVLNRTHARIPGFTTWIVSPHPSARLVGARRESVCLMLRHLDQKRSQSL